VTKFPIFPWQWDACETCFANIENDHPRHDFVKLRKSSDHYQAAKPGSRDFLGRALGLVGHDGAARHPRVVCDGMLPLLSIHPKYPKRLEQGVTVLSTEPATSVLILNARISICVKSASLTQRGNIPRTIRSSR
jgi:hypothetical protein